MASDGALHVLDYGSPKRNQSAFLFNDGSLATRFRMAVNADGTKRAYHRDDVAGGGLISLCNGGKVYPAGRAPFDGSEDCKQFSKDYAAIRAAGFKDPSVGAIHWYGVLGQGSVVVGTETVTEVVPVEQTDGSGFYVSPTALADAAAFPDPSDQRRYVDAEIVPAAVIRGGKALSSLGIKLGTCGVAIHAKAKKAVPFVVGDFGPRIGEGTFALGRLVQGLPLETATRKNIFTAHVEEKVILWVFFGGGVMPPPFTQAAVAAHAGERFAAWGGESRLLKCLADSDIPIARPD